MLKANFYFILIMTLLLSCDKTDEIGVMELDQVFIGKEVLDLSLVEDDIPVDRSITLVFSVAVDEQTVPEAISLSSIEMEKPLNFRNSGKSVVISPLGALKNGTHYTLEVSDLLKGINGESFSGVEISFNTIIGELKLDSLLVGGNRVDFTGRVTDVPLDLSMSFYFNEPIDPSSFEESFEIVDAPQELEFVYEGNAVNVTSTSQFNYLKKYEFRLSDQLIGQKGERFAGLSQIFYTDIDPAPKFPIISDEELLTKIQQQTFKYFWDFGHPVSGLARERNTSGETVTSGGSGFGVMAILVGIERGFITRQEGVDRLETIVNFLLNEADRFHGAWSHWLNGTTGDVIPFSANDNGGDLVETAFMIQGLLTVRQYLDSNDPQENAIIDNINTLWNDVEWDWYTQEGQNVLYWHWSPNFGWEKNHRIQGWNEALIIYILAASSPTHMISKSVYEEGWARSGGMTNSNGNQYYGYTLPLRSDRGGPLFFAHYSFLGLDPRNLSDKYANYWTQNVTHTRINHAYCVANPKGFVGYSEDSWGLTASDNSTGYSAHSPDNDRGVITPTAAISSIPYTPEVSMDAIRHFYYILGDRLWGEYGFYDAFNITEEWTASSYLAIDQGPIIVMIENHRTGLLWDLFMSAPEIQSGLQKLDFNYE